MSPGSGGLWTHFEKTAQRIPGHPAICAGSGRLSYGELLERAAETGAALEGLLGSRRIVAIRADLEAGTVIAILAASRARAAAVLLDRSHPADFTASVMEVMQAMLADGCGEDDHGSIIRYFEKLAHVTVAR